MFVYVYLRDFFYLYTLPRLQFMLGLHFTPSLRFALSLQSAFYTQSAFYPWSAVCSPQSAFYTDRIQKQPVCSNIKYQVYVRNSEILYLPYKLIGALDHDKPFRLCFFWREENQHTNVGKLFLFLKLIHVKFDNT